MLIYAVVSLLCNIFNLVALGECVNCSTVDDEKNAIEERDGNVIKNEQGNEF